MAQVIWTEPALNDLDAIADCIAIENPVAAARLVQRVFEHGEQLAAHPESGSRPPELKRSRFDKSLSRPAGSSTAMTVRRHSCYLSCAPSSFSVRVRSSLASERKALTIRCRHSVAVEPEHQAS